MHRSGLADFRQCDCGLGVEDAFHFFFKCPAHNANRTWLFSKIQEIASDDLSLKPLTDDPSFLYKKLGSSVRDLMQFQRQSCLFSPLVNMTTSCRNNVKTYWMQRLNIYSSPNAVNKLSLLATDIVIATSIFQNLQKRKRSETIASWPLSVCLLHPSCSERFEGKFSTVTRNCSVTTAHRSHPQNIITIIIIILVELFCTVTANLLISTSPSLISTFHV